MIFHRDIFTFLNYEFDQQNFSAQFHYLGADQTHFTETIFFQKPTVAFSYDKNLLDRALFLAFILIGTSYYKSHPTKNVKLNYSLDEFQANFFDHVYQEGLSQYAFENHLARKNLAHFKASRKNTPPQSIGLKSDKVLALQSGGKDSLLTATILKEKQIDFTPLFVSSSDFYPNIINQVGRPIIIKRTIDISALKKSNGLNGHVPVTYIIQSLALIQAILSGYSTIFMSIGQEGNEPHSQIGDLPINHQWSKTWQAEQLFAKYVSRYISSDVQIGSLLRPYSELKIAEQFATKCWKKYGSVFSSCNIANYRQHSDNSSLEWCGNCAKCANSYLLFAPFISAKIQNQLFGDTDLFSKESLTDIFKGLLGVDGFAKPFECIGEIAELRKAYELRQKDYSELPFEVPKSDFDYQKLGPAQPFIKKIML